MLLAIDAGNTNLTLGLFIDGQVQARWRLRTVHDRTADEWGIQLRQLFALSAIPVEAVKGIIIASVVPPLDQAMQEMAHRYFKVEPLFVTHALDTGLAIKIDNPRELGADRIVNGVAAFHKHGGPCIVVDLGTAITFDVVSAHAEYLGGMICAGIGMSISGLSTRTARLPKVDFREPERLIGTNTMDSMRSGLYYGFIGLIDGILERMVAELGPQTVCCATGGQAPLIVRGSRYLKEADDDLTLFGLWLLWQRNRKS